MPNWQTAPPQTPLVPVSSLPDDVLIFLLASRYKNVVRAVPKDVRKLDIYLPELRRLLAAGAGG